MVRQTDRLTDRPGKRTAVKHVGLGRQAMDRLITTVENAFLWFRGEGIKC